MAEAFQAKAWLAGLTGRMFKSRNAGVGRFSHPLRAFPARPCLTRSPAHTHCPASSERTPCLQHCTRHPTMRRHALLLFLLAASIATTTHAGTVRPNMLLIVAEDMSSRVGAFGDPVARTPAIDALASEGVRYTNVFTAAGVCAPSRAALITGTYPWSIGTQHMRTSARGYEAVPPPDVKAFPELLRAAGYATANAVKTDYQFGEPFTVWDANVGSMRSPPDLAVWRHLPADKPFFAMITLMSTHESRLATTETKGSGETAPFIAALVAAREASVAKVTDPRTVHVPPYYPDTPSVRASIAQHYDNIHAMDDEVRQILANLAADGHADDTIVIWTTDHGDGFPRAKRSVYDSGLKVPIIIRHPDGHAGGSSDDRLVSFIDIAPTLLQVAGATAPTFIQGRDFLGADSAPRRYIHAGRDRMDDVPDHVRAVRDARYKYIRNLLPQEPYFRPLAFRDMFPIMQAWWAAHAAGTLTPVQNVYFTAPRAAEELYDTHSDPFETRNLAGDPAIAPVLTRLREEMDAWLAGVGDLSREPETAMIERMWPAGKQPTTSAPEVAVVGDDSGIRRLRLTSATPGASIGYRLVTAQGPGPWLLATDVIAVPASAALEARAIRYGYSPSKLTRLQSLP
ncbi:MAG: sulfatase [Pseudomonadales bacterium]|nr:sulfatase [Pseudomonadales bacterium]